jgi:hypothetical protein
LLFLFPLPPLSPARTPRSCRLAGSTAPFLFAPTVRAFSLSLFAHTAEISFPNTFAASFDRELGTDCELKLWVEPFRYVV